MGYRNSENWRAVRHHSLSISIDILSQEGSILVSVEQDVRQMILDLMQKLSIFEDLALEIRTGISPDHSGYTTEMENFRLLRIAHEGRPLVDAPSEKEEPVEEDDLEEIL